PIGAGHPAGQARHRRVLEQGTQRHLHTQHGPDPADQPHPEQRVPTQGEEVIVHTHRRHPENLRERPTQQLLSHRRRPPPHPRPSAPVPRPRPTPAPAARSGPGSAARPSSPSAVSGSSPSPAPTPGTM